MIRRLLLAKWAETQDIFKPVTARYLVAKTAFQVVVASGLAACALIGAPIHAYVYMATAGR